MERPFKLPKDCHLTLIPVLLIFVVPFYIWVPAIQQRHFLRILNETITLLRNGTVMNHGAPDLPRH